MFKSEKKNTQKLRETITKCAKTAKRNKKYIFYMKIHINSTIIKHFCDGVIIV